MATQTRQIRMDGVSTFFRSQMDPEVAERILDALEPLYAIGKEGFQLHAMTGIDVEAVTTRIAGAMGIHLPVQLISVSDFNKGELEGRKDLDFGDAFVPAIVRNKHLLDMLESCLHAPFDKMLRAQFQNLKTCIIGGRPLGRIISETVQCLIRRCIIGGDDGDTDKVQEIAGVIELLPHLWLIGKNKEETQWLVLCA